MKIESSGQRNIEFNKIGIKQFYKKILSNNPTIIDVGANKGQTIDFFKKIFINPKIYAYEPSDQYKILKRKYIKNKKILISNYAIHNKKGKKIFYSHSFKSRDISQLSGFYKINKKSKDHIKINSSKRKEILKNINHSSIVNCITLDELIKNQKIDLLKIDTQGNELNVLKGAKKLLTKTKFVKLEIMLYDYYEIKFTFSDLDLFLNKFNFKIFNVLEVNQNPVNFKTDWIEVLYYNTKI